MLNRVIGRFSAENGGNGTRRELAEFLWKCVEAQGRLIFDEAFLKRIGVGRTRALMAMCELLLAERVHMRSNQKGEMMAMSNFEFMRFILDRAEREFTPPGAPEAPEDDASGAAARNSAFTIREEDADPPDIFCPAENAANAESGDALFENHHPFMADKGFWFAVEAEAETPDGTENGTDLPERRQTLPERRREPWFAIDGFVVKNTDNNEK